MKTAKATKTAAKPHYSDVHAFGDQKQNARYTNPSPMGKNAFRVFDPEDPHSASPERTGHGIRPITSHHIRDQKDNGYDLSGPHQYTQMKMNTFYGGQGFSSEFKDEHYKQSLTNSKVTPAVTRPLQG